MSRRPLKGRVLEASRNIKEGELVIFDKALAVVPNAEPVCLGCLRILPTSTNNLNNERYSEGNFVCEECKFPLCGKKDCDQTKWHSKYECFALKKADAANNLFKNASKNIDCDSEESGLSPAVRINQFYHVIAILRFILAQQNSSSEIKEQLQMLTDHNESR